MPWNLKRFNPHEDDTDWFAWDSDLSLSAIDRNDFVRFLVDTTSREATCPQNFVWRLFCHFLVNQIPDHGLPELTNSLADLYEFYSHRPTVAELPPPISVHPVEVVESYDRPPFHVTED